MFIDNDLIIGTAAVALAVFTVFASYDGIVIHLWRLRLQSRPISYVEHLWHTASALLFVPMVALLFVVPPSGVNLWLGMGLVVATIVVEVFDVRAETASRADIGGLKSSERALHIAAFGTRTLAIGSLLVSLPDGAWWGRVEPEPAFAMIRLVGGPVLAGAVMVAALHLWLAYRHRSHCPCRCGPVMG